MSSLLALGSTVIGPEGTEPSAPPVPLPLSKISPASTTGGGVGSIGRASLPAADPGTGTAVPPAPACVFVHGPGPGDSPPQAHAHSASAPAKASCRGRT